MENVWFLAAVWLGLALMATLLAIWLKISTALSEIVVGTIAQLIIGVIVGRTALGSSSAWVTFLAGTGAIVLTFLAGAELDPAIFATKWKEVVVVGLAGFFSPFTLRTVVFVAVSVLTFIVLPFLTPRFFRRYGGRVSELETKFILLALFGLGGVALWADSEPVLPAYVIGMVLAGSVGKDHLLIRRLRTLTFGLLTPFYFIRAGSFVSVPALLGAPLTVIVLFFAKMLSKMLGVFPAVKTFQYAKQEAVYYTLMMSTGLTFGTISALFGLSHGIITPEQYSYLVATVIGSAVIPTLIANAYFMPIHLRAAEGGDAELEATAHVRRVGQHD